MNRLATTAGLIRSAAIYLCRPDRTRAQARFYASLLAPGDLAFDIGAHMGNRSRALHKAGARVVAVEPQVPFHRILRATLPTDVVLIKAAAGAQEGEATLHVAPRFPTVSTLSTDFQADASDLPGFGQVRWSEHQKTPVTTLDALITAHGTPHYIKIDVEGHEAEVLAGLTAPVTLISIEVIPGLHTRAKAAFDQLAKIGPYLFNVARGEEGAFLFDRWMDRAALDSWIRHQPAGAKPCDVYARRCES
ncbi:MAG: FkbM family methyltransferase [Dinoroseobacter sp.]|nr:FkbM family methyltransferase [Dinoroseobacter sp.]